MAEDAASEAGVPAAAGGRGGYLANPWQLVLAVAALLVVLVVVVRSGWMSDDAYITWRVVDNFWNGHGLRWNVSERVCVYTNPLLMLCMLALYPLTGEAYYTGIFLNVAATMAAVGLLAFRLARGWAPAVVAAALLISSKAFVDYATSGLETSLSYLLLAGTFCVAFFRDTRRPVPLLALSLLAGLTALNRMDTLLLVAPLLAHAWWQKRTLRRVGIVAAGLLPFLAWEAFALIYYGRLFPNTAYAKLGGGLPLSFYLRSGLRYYTNSLRLDPLTLPVIVLALAASVRLGTRKHLAAGAGVLLYLIYVVRVGGDFMSGRFFAVPMFAAVGLWCLLERRRPGRQWVAPAIAAGVVPGGLALLHPLNPVFTPATYSGKIAERLQHWKYNHGIDDERGWYHPTTGLLMAPHYASMPAHTWRRQGQEARRAGKTYRATPLGIGMYAHFAGAGMHVVDEMALADPLLAMVPVRRDRAVRIGHMQRFVPPDYEASIRSGENRFRDPKLAALYDALKWVHAGPIWSRRRWSDIWKLHTGGFDRLIDEAYFRFPPRDAPPARGG